MAKSKFFKNCIALLLITLVAGLALASVNEITKAPIAKAEEQARLDAYNAVYEGVEFKTIDNTDILLGEAQAALDAENLSACSVNDVLAATDESGNVAGYVMSATSPTSAKT